MLKDIKDLEKTANEKMGHPIEFLHKELSSIRTGRATPAVLDGVQVDYFNTPTPISQLASVSAPESRLIVVQPWDPTVLAEMEKAILRANLGLTPTNDGKVIRISIPALTEERRKELVKVAKKMGGRGQGGPAQRAKGAQRAGQGSGEEEDHIRRPDAHQPGRSPEAD